MISWTKNEKVDSLLLEFWNGSIPVNVFELADRLNIIPEYSKTFCNNRIRFCIAHQISHKLNNDCYISNCHLEIKNFNSENTDYHEKRANLLTLEILMPSEAIRIMIMYKNITNLNELSNAFQVSEAAMSLRLKTLEWI